MTSLSELMRMHQAFEDGELPLGEAGKLPLEEELLGSMFPELSEEQMQRFMDRSTLSFEEKALEGSRA